MGNPQKMMSSGILVNLYWPEREQIRFSDISVHLNNLTRYGGLSDLINVARHTVLGARILKAEKAPAAFIQSWLGHDMHEAFIGEITTPMKNAIEHEVVDEYPGNPIKAIEERFDDIIYGIAGISPNRVSIKRMDKITCATEVRYMLGRDPVAYGLTDEMAEYGWNNGGSEAGLGRMTNDEVQREFNDLVKAYLPSLFAWEGGING